MAATLTIAGADKYKSLERDSWQLTRAAMAKASLSGEILSDDGTYRPELDDPVVMTQDAVTFFGGEIESVRERGIGGAGAGAAIINEITARDFNARLSRRFVTATLADGSTVKQAAQVLVTFIPGATLDPLQADGPALPELVWSDTLNEEAVKQVCDLAGGWIAEVDADLVFRIYEPGTIAAPFNITLANQKALGDIVVEPTRQGYANHVIVRNATFRKTATDPSYNASTNAREMLVTVPDETPEDAVQATADTMLARALVELKRVEYPTDEPGLKPGMTQVIDYAPRNINNTFLITDIDTREIAGGVLMHFVKAIEGLIYQTGWRETYRQWGGGGSLTVAVGGGGAPTMRYAIPLGGTGTDFVIPSNAWVPASGGGVIGQNPFQAQINTVARGTTAATVTGRLRAEDAGVGVKARLYDVTDNVACAGESALVTDTNWQTVTFGVTLTAGSHFYELQLWCATVDAWVRAAGFILE